MKASKRLTIVALILMIVCLCVSIGSVFAVVSGIYETHEVTAISDYLTIDDETGAFKEFFNVASATTLTVHKTHNAQTALEISGVDLLVFADTTLAQTSYSQRIDLTGGRYCYVFFVPIAVGATSANFTFTPTSQTDVTVLAAASKATQDGVERSYRNEYISSFFDLQRANDQSLYENPDRVVSLSESFCTIWILDDLTIAADYTLLVPCYFNLLNSTVTLLGDFSIRHYFGGLYTIEGISGGFYADAAVSADIKIIAPKAYYSTNYLTSDKLVNINLDLTGVDFSLTDDSDLKTAAIFDDALSYAIDRVPSQVFSDAVLAFEYHSSGIRFEYLLNGQPIKQWSVEPQTSDNDVVLTINAIFDGNIVRTGTKTVTVFGTGDDSIANAALIAINNQMKTHYVSNSDGKISDFNKRSDMFGALAAVLKAAKAPETLSVSLTDISGSHFEYGAEEFDEFSLTFDVVASTFELTVGANSYDLSVSDKIWFVPATFLEMDSQATVSVTYGASIAATQNFVWAGNTREELESYINRMTNTPYVMSMSDITSIFYLSPEGKLVLNGTNLINIFAYDDVTTNVLRITDEQYEALLDGSASVSDFVDENSFAGFSTVDGSLIPISQVSYENGYVYVFSQTFRYDADSVYFDAANPDFTVFREIVIPNSGIGGDEYERYLSGATFASYFDSLPNNRLLDTSDFVALASNADVYMSLSFVDAEGLATAYDFCKFTVAQDNYMTLYDSVEKTQSFKLAIDISKVPEVNSAIYMNVIFFTQTAVSSSTAGAVQVYYVEGAEWSAADRCFMLNNAAVTEATDGATQMFFAEDALWQDGRFWLVREISVQRYGFIIPGIYFCSSTVSTAQFYDQAFYDAIIFNILNNINLTTTVVVDPSNETYNLNNYIYSEGSINYLLTDGANIVDKMIYTTSDATATLNPKGAEYLINASEMDFSGFQITSLDAFASYSGSRLVTLRMKGCGLSNSIVQQNLYAINTLLTVDLSDNELSSLDGILYRTVRTLNVCGQRNSSNTRVLTSLKGISNLIALRVLDVSDNAIDEFYLLTRLSYLTTVTLYGNIGSGSSGFYGTCGSVNIAEYVTLLQKGVVVFAASTALEVAENAVVDVVSYTVTSISTRQRLAALQVNAIYIAETQYDFVLMPLTIGDCVVSLVALTKGGVEQTTMQEADAYGANKITCSSLSDGDEISVIIAITLDGVTLHKQFNLTYRVT